MTFNFMLFKLYIMDTFIIIINILYKNFSYNILILLDIIFYTNILDIHLVLIIIFFIKYLLSFIPFLLSYPYNSKSTIMIITDFITSIHNFIFFFISFIIFHYINLILFLHHNLIFIMLIIYHLHLKHLIFNY